MTAPATRLRRVRHLRATRTGAGAAGLESYTVYLLVMLTLIVVAPVIRAAALALADPPVVALLRAPAAEAIAPVMVGLALAGMLLLGGVRGPALLSPFLTVAVAGNDLPRSATLRRPFLLSSTVIAGLVIGGAALLGGVLAGAGVAPLVTVAFGVGTVSTVVMLVVTWLVGQRLSRGVASLAAAVVAGGALVTAVVPGVRAVTPWGWAGTLYPGTADLAAWPQVIGLALLALGGVVAVRFLLDGMQGSGLFDQARRWQAVGAFGAVGDLASALAQFRALPTVGRRWQAVRHRPLVVTFLLRDLVGALRMPARFAVAVVGLAAGGFALAAVGAVPGAVGWVPAVAGASLAYLSLGVWSDGFRHGVQTWGQPAFYGVGGRRLLSLHAVFPVLSVLVLAGTGGLIAVTVLGVPSGLLTALGCSLYLVCVRVYDAAKGPMPPSVLTPIPTPVGDASGLVVAYWQAEALVVGPVVAAIVATTASGIPWVLVVLLPVSAVVLLFTRSRLHR